MREGGSEGGREGAKEGETEGGMGGERENINTPIEREA